MYKIVAPTINKTLEKIKQRLKETVKCIIVIFFISLDIEYIMR